MVNKLLKNGTNLMYQRQTTILSAAGVLMIMAAGTAVLGLIKLRLMSGLGKTPLDVDMLDAFKLAFRLPDLMFQVLIAGALNAAFIPVFGELLGRKDRSEAWRLVSSMMTSAVVIFGLVGLFVFIFAEPLTALLSPGLLKDAPKLFLTAQLTRLMMLSPIILGMSAFLTGSLQVQHRFIMPALAPVLYNLGGIIGIVWLYPRVGVWGLAYGVLLGAILHLAIQLPVAHASGFRFQVMLQWKDVAVRRVGKLMVPRTFGLSIDQIESVVLGGLVTLLGSGAPFLFSQIFSLITFPISFFGVSIAQASLPTMAREAREDIDAFRQTLFTTFHQILYLIIPVAVLLVVLRLPIIRIALNFPNWETQTLPAAQILLFFGAGLIAQSAIHLWVRGFYALEETVAPLLAGAVGVVTSVFVSLLTLNALGLRGIALAMTVGGYVTLIALMSLMRQRIGGFSWASFYAPMVRILFSGVVMAVAVYFPVKPLERLFDTTKTSDLVMVSLLVGGFGLSLYLFISWVLGSAEVVIFFKVAQKLRSWREAFVKMPIVEETPIVSEVQAD